MSNETKKKAGRWFLPYYFLSGLTNAQIFFSPSKLVWPTFVDWRCQLRCFCPSDGVSRSLYLVKTGSLIFQSTEVLLYFPGGGFSPAAIIFYHIRSPHQSNPFSLLILVVCTACETRSKSCFLVSHFLYLKNTLNFPASHNTWHENAL